MILAPDSTPVRKNSARQVLGVMLSFGALVGLIGAAALIFTLRQPPPLDSNGCRIDGKYSNIAIILIDQSDPFSPNERKNVRDRVENWAREAPIFSKISLQRINAENPTEPIEIWFGCSPGRIEGMSLIEQINTNAALAARTWQRRIGTPLNEALQTLDVDREAHHSPIIESVLEILKDPDFNHAAGERRIVLFSDMMQNTDTWSVLRSKPTWDSFSRSELGRRPLPHIRELSIEAFWIERAGQTAELAKFWREFMSKLGTYSVEGPSAVLDDSSKSIAPQGT